MCAQQERWNSSKDATRMRRRDAASRGVAAASTSFHSKSLSLWTLFTTRRLLLLLPDAQESLLHSSTRIVHQSRIDWTNNPNYQVNCGSTFHCFKSNHFSFSLLNLIIYSRLVLNRKVNK